MSTLARRKAAGLILANPDNAKQFEAIKNTFRDYSLRERLSLPHIDAAHSAAEWDTLKFINTITIPNAEVKGVSGLSIANLKKLVSERKISEAPITKIKIKFEKFEDVIHTANVVGVIKGRSNKFIVISAHYDHLGKSSEEFFPGADDNASGTAALLELAEAFSGQTDLPYSMVFLATSGEEAGLLGSRYHVNTPEFNPKDILCNLNLDMISRIDDRHGNAKYLYCIGTGQSLELDSVIKKADSMFADCHVDYSLNSDDPTGIFARTDSYSFYRKGIPAIHFFSGLHSDYHKPTDTPDKINFENLANRVRLISLVIALLQK
jgi:Iap family predicted aminopeptidase